VRRAAFSTILVLAAILAGCAESPPPKIVGIDPYIAGARALQTGDDDRATGLLQQALEANPDLIMAREELGDLYRKRQNYQQASSQYEVAVKLDAYNFKIHYDLGLSYQFLDRLEDAVKAYLRAIALEPRDLNSNMNLGLVYLALGRPADALAQMKTAVDIDPHSSAAQCNLGIAFEANGEWTKAESAYRRAMELDPDQPAAMLDLGVNLVHQNRGNEAVIALTAAARKIDTAQVHKHLGDAYVLLHRDDEALHQYDIAMRENPRYWQAMDQAGLILLRKYQAGMTLDEDLRLNALSFWQKSLAIYPDQPTIRKWVDKWGQGGKVLP
jgi:tetratricopeptide (TPR) repeat protein